MSDTQAHFRFGGAVVLRLSGPERLLRHFDAEYGEARVRGPEEPDADVDVRLVPGVGPRPDGDAVVFTGRHKTALWRVVLGDPGSQPLQARIGIGGGPLSFTSSLVQGYVIEALVAGALAGRGRVALPGAAFGAGEGAVVLVGRSGAGKTTLTARALASGRPVLSDDQVVLDAEGGVRRFPRRLRLYPDIRRTAPAAWSRLPVRTRTALTLRRVARDLSRGHVAPSLAVPVHEVGPTVVHGPLPVRRLVVVGRTDGEEVAVTPRAAEWAVRQAAHVMAEQWARLTDAVDGRWATALAGVRAAELEALERAVQGIPVTEVVIPRSWGAARSVGALERILDLSPGRGSGLAEAHPASGR